MWGNTTERLLFYLIWATKKVFLWDFYNLLTEYNEEKLIKYQDLDLMQNLSERTVEDIKNCNGKWYISDIMDSNPFKFHIIFPISKLDFKKTKKWMGL